MPLLEISDLTKRYPGAPRPVLTGVDLTLERGETLALTGESGSGKSTLLHLAAALDGFDGGRIALDGQGYGALDEAGRAEIRRGKVAVVFQQFNLIPSLSVAQNIRFHARLCGRIDADWLNRLVSDLGLDEFADRYPEQLSGGQQQRVAIGRALAARPMLLLADEPTGNLDETASEAVLALMLGLVEKSGAALLMATHSQAIASRLSRRVHLAGGRLT